MIEHYIYLLAKSYFWVATIAIIFEIISLGSVDALESYENRRNKRIEKGVYHMMPIRTIIMWTLYWLSILIYFKI